MCEVCEVAKEIIDRTELYSEDSIDVARAIVASIDMRMKLSNPFRKLSRAEMIAQMTDATIAQINRKVEATKILLGTEHMTTARLLYVSAQTHSQPRKLK